MHRIIIFMMIVIWIACSSDRQDSENSAAQKKIKSKLHQPVHYIGNDFLIDDQHSYLGFKIKYFGFSPVRGRFNEFDGTLFYDEAEPGSISVSLFIDVNTINTGNEQRDEDLKREGTWFDAINYPHIQFTSSDVITYTDGSFDLIGEITVKGITLTDTISFNKPTSMSKDWAGNDQVDFSGSFTINRQNFNVFGGDFWSSVMENGLTQLSDQVEIEIDMHCRKPDYQVRYDDADSADISKMILDIIRQDGIKPGLKKIDELHQNGNISSGKLSTIGYTLNEWNMYDHALKVFTKRLEYFPEKVSTLNQIGITNLHLENVTKSENYFEQVLSKDPTNSRAHEYLRLIHTLD